MLDVAKRVDRFQWLRIPSVMYRMRLIIAVLILMIITWPGAIAGEGTWESVYEFGGTATVNIQSDFEMPSSSGGSWTRHWQANIVYHITGTEGEGSQLRPSGSITGSLYSEERKVSGKCETKTVCDGTIQEKFGRSPKRAGPQIKINRKLGLYMLSFPSADPEGDCTATDSCLGKTFHKQGPLRKIVVYVPAPYCINRQECTGASFDPKSKMISGNYSTTTEDPITRQRTQISANWTFRLVKPEPPKIKVKAVHFNDGSNNLDNTLTLRRHQDETEIKAPEWKDDGTRKPAAFVLGYDFTVKVIFEAEDDVDKARIRVDEKAIQKNGFGGLKPVTGKKEIDFENNIAEVRYIIQSAPQEVGIFEVLWQWNAEIKLRNRNEFEKEKHFETTDHTVYVVAKSPIPTANTYEYVVRKSCEWADGESDPDAVFNAIWKNFWDIPSPDRPEFLLLYNHGPGVPDSDTGKLLRETDGTCEAWADFFSDTVGSHGIGVDKIIITPKEPFNVMVATKEEAQGTRRPARVFRNHVITAYNCRYYDPSYHIDEEQDLQQYENQAFIAYCNIKEFDADPNSLGSLYRWFKSCRHFYDPHFIGLGDENPFADCLEQQETPGCQVNDPDKCEVTAEPVTQSFYSP